MTARLFTGTKETTPENRGCFTFQQNLREGTIAYCFFDLL
jgi:hypothetical protein